MSFCPRRSGRIERLSAVAAIALCLLTAAAGNAWAARTALGDGRFIINVVDDFLEYADAAARADAESRSVLWNRMLESRHPEFFSEVIYRKTSGPDREAFKKELLRRFWTEIFPRLSELRETNRAAVGKMLEARRAFQAAFPDFRPDCDYYLTVSFSFHGKVVEMGGRPVLAVGLENFRPGDPALDIAIAHEQFHLYHFRTFSTRGALYRSVWAEGLAVTASEVLVPGQRFSRYLGFSGQRMNEIHGAYARLARELALNLDNADHAVKRAWLGMEPNRLNVPPGAGYYLGRDMIHVLLKQGWKLAQLARLSPEEARRLLIQAATAIRPE